MGFLSSADVIECSASDLVGKYIGHTGPKTKAVFEKALGKILFVDEAYRLSEGQFAKEAMDEIVGLMTQERFMNKLIIILAGYEHEMNSLLSVNPGLSSRFAEEIMFQNMTPEQCLTLLDKDLSKSGITIAELKDTSSTESAEMKSIIERMSRLSSWGNARDMKTIGKRMVQRAFSNAANNPGQTASLTISEAVAILNSTWEDQRGRLNVPTIKHLRRNNPSPPPVASSSDSPAPPPPPTSSSSSAANQGPKPPPPPPHQPSDSSRNKTPKPPRNQNPPRPPQAQRPQQPTRSRNNRQPQASTHMPALNAFSPPFLSAPLQPDANPQPTRSRNRNRQPQASTPMPASNVFSPAFSSVPLQPDVNPQPTRSRNRNRQPHASTPTPASNVSSPAFSSVPLQPDANSQDRRQRQRWGASNNQNATATPTPGNHASSPDSSPNCPCPRDRGVSNAVWNQLQADKAAEEERKRQAIEEERRLQQELRRAESEERQAETYARVLENERRRVEEERARLAEMERQAAEARRREAQFRAARDRAVAELMRKQEEEERRRREDAARRLAEFERQAAEARRRQEAARAARERAAAELRRKQQEEAQRRQKIEEAQRRLRMMGVCVQGFPWIRQSSGWRCAGGMHFVLDGQLGMSGI